MSEQATRPPVWMRAAAVILAAYMRVVFFTGRKVFIDPHHMQGVFSRGEQLILAAWHRHTLQTPFNYLSQAPKGRRLYAIASASKDGALAAMGLYQLGIDSVRGSSSRGGMGALRRMVKLIKEGNDLAFTPDGPRGPLYEVADGVLVAARLSGAPIVPISFAARSRRLLRSWDRLVVPLPFSRMRFTYGVPLYIPRDSDDQEMAVYRQKLRDELMRISDLAERFD